MLYKHSLTLAWFTFLSIIVLEILVDYGIRSSSANFYDSGISQSVWFIPQFFAFILGGYFLSFRVRKLKNIKSKVLSISIHTILATIIYLIILYSYILGTGIDSF